MMKPLDSTAFDFVNFYCDGGFDAAAVYEVPGHSNLLVAEKEDGTFVLCAQWRFDTVRGPVENLFIEVWSESHRMPLGNVLADVERIVAAGQDPASSDTWLDYDPLLSALDCGMSDEENEHHLLAGGHAVS